MLHRVMMLTAGLLGAALLAPAEGVAQDKPAVKWGPPVAIRGQDAVKERKPAPRRTINGMWNALRLGNQSGGVQLKPNNGRPENELPYTPYGLELYRSHKPLEGRDSVSPAFNNDPRTKCEPLGFPRWNHYDLGVQVFQDEHKIMMAYNYDSRWRVIWTDGRSLPTVVDGGVEVDGEYRDARWFGTRSAGGSTITRSKWSPSASCRTTARGSTTPAGQSANRRGSPNDSAGSTPRQWNGPRRLTIPKSIRARGRR